MNVTRGKFKDRQLHTEGHLQRVSAEQGEYAEASACLRIAENTDIITDLQATGLLEEILQSVNLNRAYYQNVCYRTRADRNAWNIFEFF